MKRVKLSTQMLTALEKSLFMWYGKLAGRIIISGVIYGFAAPFLHEWTGVEWGDTDMYFLKASPGMVAIVTGLMIFLVRKWDGHIKK